MKIYNKKAFWSGVLMAAMGAANLAVSAWRRDWDAKGILLTGALLFMGGGTILRSLSREFAREDRLDELDERNRLIGLRSKSKAFQLTQGVSFGLMLLLLAAGKLSGEESLIAIGVGLAFAFSISMFAEIFAFFYYESKV